ncbi:hypothetical protein OHA45_29525 [Streptomyces lydicus]|uniref:hypothetical protein n=1 Tax=Streptomyces lydicus TaxID=47763 RepID=UPI002E3311AC|nr:hypothetical protein [Streptomyces lydicus]
MPGTQAHATPSPAPHPYTGPTEPTAPTECYAGPTTTNTATNAATNTATAGNDALTTETDADVTRRPSGTAPAHASAHAPAPARRTAASPPADCLQCGEPTEYPVEQPGIVLCPVCEWQEAQRSACSG